MRIGDAAAAAGTTPRALRFYEEWGLLPPARRTATGQREYGPDELAKSVLSVSCWRSGSPSRTCAASSTGSACWSRILSGSAGTPTPMSPPRAWSTAESQRSTPRSTVSAGCAQNWPCAQPDARDVTSSTADAIHRPCLELPYCI
ncbi:helix-turn-helix domain-containing protein [Streptomyces chartreusis]|uniref:helix-turn-helix domain-containing protein n=1 Tax=Streptomyces chartreusis TaxID=1969 RepID=UPI0037D88FFD